MLIYHFRNANDLQKCDVISMQITFYSEIGFSPKVIQNFFCNLGLHAIPFKSIPSSFSYNSCTYTLCRCLALTCRPVGYLRAWSNAFTFDLTSLISFDLISFYFMIYISELYSPVRLSVCLSCCLPCLLTFCLPSFQSQQDKRINVELRTSLVHF
jgi:hypothetical protein